MDAKGLPLPRSTELLVLGRAESSMSAPRIAVDPAVDGVAIVAAALVAPALLLLFNCHANMDKDFRILEPSFRYSL